MRTTDKNHPVFAYILTAISNNWVQEYGRDKEPETDAEKLQAVLDAFRSEYGYNINRIGEYAAFREWLMGLPSVIDIDFENYRILELAQLWNSIPDNATERQKDRMLDNWFNFITVKFFQLCRRNKVQ